MARLNHQPHGGNVYAVSRELGRDVMQLIDFSASINPLGPSPHVWRAITEARHLLGHYPDPDCWDLRHALAEHWRRDPDQILVGNGSMELIDVLPRALRIRHVLVVRPTFSEYAAAVERAGGRVTALYAKRAAHYAPPIEALCRLIATRRHGFQGVVLCNPNSPTGQACSVEDIARLADIAERRGLWLVIDEAFADFCPDRSALARAAAWPRVVILRSLTKFYGLPGLRVGCAIAAPVVIRSLRQQLPPWSVNAMGQVAALAALNDTAHARKSVRFMSKERARLAWLLETLPGCTVMPAYANYLFMELPRGWRANRVATELRREGLLIRDCSTVPGATTRSVRVAVRARIENDRLMRALTRLFRSRVS